MGLTEGTEGTVIRRGGFGGPMQLRIRGYDLLIRRNEADKIDVDLVEAELGRRRRRWWGMESDAE